MQCSFAVTAVRLIVLGSESGKTEMVASTLAAVEHLMTTLD